MIRPGTFAATAVLALALAACDSSAPAVGLSLRGPSAVAAFRGVTSKQPGIVTTYVAIANGRGSDLVLLDPSDDRAVVSPGLVFALSVPTAPRPLHLAATSLGDGPDLADALVVAGPPDAAGEVVLQLVSTWDGAPRVVEELGLGPGAPGPILAMLATPAPDGAGLPRPGLGRVVVATRDGRFTVVTLARGPAGSVGFVSAGTAALGFEATDLALSPDGRHLYAATGDLVSGTDGFSAEGVAEIDAAADDPAAWTVTALDARAPTRAVAAVRVRERDLRRQGDGTLPGADDLLPDAALRVYAALDPSRCGSSFAIGCGVATLDPVAALGGRGGLAADPRGELPFRAPIPVPGVPLDIVAWNDRPVARPPTLNDEFDGQRGIRLSPGTGARATDAVALVTSSDGNVYVLDLSRFGPPLDAPGLRGSTRLQITGASAFIDRDLNYFPADGSLDPAVTPRIGLWTTPPAPESPEVGLEAGQLAESIAITYGFTDSDTFTVAWQGGLPGLVGRDAVLWRERDLGGDLVIAFQTPIGPLQTATAWAQVAPVYDPALGVELDDVVEFTVDGACAAPELPSPIPPGFTTNALVDARVTEILAPDHDRWPGGALRLRADPDEPRWEGCFAELALGTRYTGGANVRARELVLTSVGRGYLTRPVLDAITEVAYPLAGSTGPTEDALAALCSIPRWPGPEATIPACDASCRLTCQALHVVRSARRFYFPGAESCERACEIPGLETAADHPTDAGPVARFRVGIRDDRSLPRPAASPPRNSGVTFSTQSGFRPMSRAPRGAGLPGGFAVVDRSGYPGAEEAGIVAYVPYDGDAVFGVAASAAVTVSVLLR